MATQLEAPADDELLNGQDEGDEQDLNVNDDAVASEAGESDGEPTEQDTIGWGDEAVTGVDEPEAVRNLRESIKVHKREKAALEAENKRLRGEEAQEQAEPDPEDYWDNPEGFKTAMRAHVERERQRDEQQQAQQRQAERQQRRWEEQRGAMDRGYEALTFTGKDAARTTVEDAFPGEQYAYLVKAAGDRAAAFIYLLGNSKDRRDKLAAMAKDGDWAEFIATAARMATEVRVGKVTTRPETNHSASGRSGGGAEAERNKRDVEAARRTGDRTKLIFG